MLKNLLLTCTLLVLPVNAMQRLLRVFPSLNSINQHFALPGLRLNAQHLIFNRLNAQYQLPTGIRSFNPNRYMRFMHRDSRRKSQTLVEKSPKVKAEQKFKFSKHLPKLTAVGIVLGTLTFKALANDSNEQQSQATFTPTCINNDLYVGKVNDKFYLAMERVNEENIDMWLGYAKAQYQKALEMTNCGGHPFLKACNGAYYFRNVIAAYKRGNVKSTNELWIAYASNVPVAKKAILQYKKPNPFEEMYTSDNPHIEMYVTILTSSEALVTSHMGISRTCEAAQALQSNPNQQKQSDQSIHLHSFAAKVMKTRDPRKVSMFTFPNNEMREIMLKKLPLGSMYVFSGNKIASKKYLESTDIQDGIYLLQCPIKKQLITFDRYNPNYQWLFSDPYKNWSTLNVLIDLDTLATVKALTSN